MADTRKVGVLGGGQLGRMLIEAANRLNIQVNVLDATASPAKQISAHDGHIEGSFKDAAAVKKLAESCDVVTVEIEYVHQVQLLPDDPMNLLVWEHFTRGRSGYIRTAPAF